jgi:NADP-dependent 3-hydroxy acid dehydrogenase YdfG
VGRNPGKYAAVLQELEGIGRTALAPAISDIERGLGDIDILVNNAGIASVSG